MKVDKCLKKQLLGYMISGIGATGTDYIVYNCLIYWGISSYSVAKMISFLCGTVVAFFYNKKVTFKVTVSDKVSEKSYRALGAFFMLYIISMAVNVAINSFSFALFRQILSFQYSLTAAFLLATITSMAINFLGQKYWVFAKISYNMRR